MSILTRQPLVSIADLMARAKERQEAKILQLPVAAKIEYEIPQNEPPKVELALHAEESSAWQYTSAQEEFISRAVAGETLVLFGAAGTGKTTSLKGVVKELVYLDKLPLLLDPKHRHLVPGQPGILVVSFMNRAVANDKKVLAEFGLQLNCLTLHKLLEYQPDMTQVYDEELGRMVTRRTFVPKRVVNYKLDSAIKIIVIDEAGNTPLELYQQLIEALPDPSNVQFIFMGDLYQIPPVFGAAILGHKGAELKNARVVLTEVKRQDKDSPILALATHIRKGDTIPAKDFAAWSVNGLEIRPWKRQVSEIEAMGTMRKYIESVYDSGQYDPYNDAVIMLQNIKFGGDELNKHIAQMLAIRHERKVFEVIAGFTKAYFAVGDAVVYNKEDCIIKSIQPNPKYDGIMPQIPSLTLDYWGHESRAQEKHLDINEYTEAVLNMRDTGWEEERKLKASHIVELSSRLDPEKSGFLDTASMLNNLSLGYVCTVHKALGAEWKRVYLLIHGSNKNMLCREILYTAITRAQSYLTIICESDTLVRGVKNQKIPGESVDEKLEYFQDRPFQIRKFNS